MENNTFDVGGTPTVSKNYSYYFICVASSQKPHLLTKCYWYSSSQSRSTYLIQQLDIYYLLTGGVVPLFPTNYYQPPCTALNLLKI